MTIANEKVKRLMDFRKRTYALLSMQASLEGATIIDIVERAIEVYANPSVKEIINSQYGEWEERSKTKRSGRPKTKNIESTKVTKSQEVLNSDNEEDNKDDLIICVKDNKIEDITSVGENLTSEENLTGEETLTDEEREILDCYDS